MNSRRAVASRVDDDKGAASREVGLNRQKIKGDAKQTDLGVGTEGTGASGKVKKRGAEAKGSSSGSKKKAAAESAKSGEQLSLDIDVTRSTQRPELQSRGGPSRDAQTLPPSEWEPLDVLHASAEVGIAAREGGQASEQGADSADDVGAADRAGGGSSDESSDSKAAMIYNDFDPEAGQEWEDGESVPFAHLASTLDAVQATSKRLEITAIMTNAFRRVIVKSPSDVVAMVHITLGRVAPAHEGLELGVGDGVLIQAIAKTMGVDDKRIKEEYKKTGDLATVAASAKGKQTTLARPKPLTVAGVFAALEHCAAVQGKDSVKVRRDIICGLLMAARQNEALWIIRVLQGKLRAGLAEPTVVTALAYAIVLSPPPASGQEVPSEEERKGACSAAAEALKMALARLPCYKTVVPILMEHPFAELAARCPLTPGVPVKAMLAHPSKGIPEVMKRFENQTVTCEYKYDGERAQVHILADGSVKLFSRNSEDSTGKFPDIVRLMPSTVKPSTHNGVIDCEVVAYDVAQARILPFQVNFHAHKRTYRCTYACTHICTHICARARTHTHI
jgi:DNA ligase-1